MLSALYDRKELALRMGIIFAGASGSGAFGGVLARGLYAIPTTATVNYHWRWIVCAIMFSSHALANSCTVHH